ncbi:MAG: di-trans,poly-cis-decaprenylcistransferase [Holosporaceae bacterium]|jgi:undecaprenyl diphosphate synthase|nr:di-trans,poly-cis-decaprenylcistransferase [Holosporaceae bacterium]
MSESLEHIAFILDGNRRWAKKENVSVSIGHQKGYEKVKEITPFFHEYGIKYVTYYLFSVENWNRSEEEIEALMKMFRDWASSALDYMNQHGIRIIAIGNLELLPRDILIKIRHLEEDTKSNATLIAIVAISYGGRDEIVRAVKKIAMDVVSGKLDIDSVNENKFSSYLDTVGLPYPDMVIRTGEKRISNFLIWQSAYSEMLFIEKLWPDFCKDDLKEIVAEFSRRKRRYGK